MFGPGVERTTRTMCPSAVPPAGVPVSMPPSSQEAERPAEHRAGARWALRALVIGGLAGAAWLLTGAAAHAADRAPASGGLLGSSLIGGIVDGDLAPPVVRDVLEVATRPLTADPERDSGRRAASRVLTEPARILSEPVEVVATTLRAVTGEATGEAPAVAAVDPVARDLTGANRLTGGPADSPQPHPVAAPHTRTGLPGPDLPALVAEREPDEPAPGVAAATRTAESGERARSRTSPAGSVSKRHSTVTDRHPATASPTRADDARDHTPGGDGPAPLQVHLGSLSGTSTSASSAHSEGGSTAILPAAVAGSTVAHHRLTAATDESLRRIDAGEPTVSPD